MLGAEVPGLLDVVHLRVERPHEPGQFGFGNRLRVGIPLRQAYEGQGDLRISAVRLPQRRQFHPLRGQIPAVVIHQQVVGRLDLAFRQARFRNGRGRLRPRNELFAPGRRRERASDQ